MSGGAPARSAIRGGGPALSLVVTALFLPATAIITRAQVHGVPPSVTSIQFHVPPFLPNIMPSVTSLGPYGIGYRPGPIPPPYSVNPRPRGYGHGNKFFTGFNTGAWIAPYFIPVYDSAYGYDSGGGGPYLYSGPPAEQTLHIVVDLPPSKPAASPEPDDEAMVLPATPLRRQEADAPPIDETVLVFRDGHQQEVTNYAIMGQTVYVFDWRTRKIGLGDLDVPATIKLNDDRGVEFRLPRPNPS